MPPRATGSKGGKKAPANPYAKLAENKTKWSQEMMEVAVDDAHAKEQARLDASSKRKQRSYKQNSYQRWDERRMIEEDYRAFCRGENLRYRRGDAQQFSSYAELNQFIESVVRQQFPGFKMEYEPMIMDHTASFEENVPSASSTSHSQTAQSSRTKPIPPVQPGDQASTAQPSTSGNGENSSNKDGDDDSDSDGGGFDMKAAWKKQLHRKKSKSRKVPKSEEVADGAMAADIVISDDGGEENPTKRANRLQEKQPLGTTPSSLQTSTKVEVLDLTKSSAPTNAEPPAPPLTEEQKKIMESINEGHNVFITGSAGVGKSFTLRHVIKNLKKSGHKVYVTAPTGLAAVNMGHSATTIHSFAGIGLGKEPARNYIDKMKSRDHKGSPGRRWRECDVLIIDEVSMLSADLFAKLSAIAKGVRELPGLPFGGIQVIVCGDFFQLPPVSTNIGCPRCGNWRKDLRIPHDSGEGKTLVQCIATHRRNQWGKSVIIHDNQGQCSFVFDPATRFCFQASPSGENAWDACNFKMHELTTVFRQSNGPFVKMLNQIRWGIVGKSEVQVLNSSRRKAPAKRTSNKKRSALHDASQDSRSQEDEKVAATLLYARNKDVDEENMKHFSKLSSPIHTFTARDRCSSKGDSMMKRIQSDCQAYASMDLRVGAQVILLRNINTSEGLVNGARGVIVDFILSKDYLGLREDQDEADEDPMVAGFCRDHKFLPVVYFSALDQERCIPPASWEMKLDEEWATRTQIPLKLAWAITIHKSQGMSIDKVAIDLKGVFSCGQAYVALSRATSLEGMRLLNFTTKCIQVNNDVVQFYTELGCSKDAVHVHTPAATQSPPNHTQQQTEKIEARVAPANVGSQDWSDELGVGEIVQVIELGEPSLSQAQTRNASVLMTRSSLNHSLSDGARDPMQRNEEPHVLEEALHRLLREAAHIHAKLTLGTDNDEVSFSVSFQSLAKDAALEELEEQSAHNYDPQTSLGQYL